MFIRFDATHERDRQTDRHRMTALAALMHSIARQKLYVSRLYWAAIKARYYNNQRTVSFVAHQPR